MTIEQLIEEGEKLKSFNRKNEYGDWFEGQEYEEWKAKSLLFIERTYGDTTVGKDFILASKQTDMKSYNKMMGILKALKNYD